MKAIQGVLRFGGIICSLITFSVMAATSRQQEGAGSSFMVRFSDFPAYNYMIALNVISFMYSFWQLILLGRYGEYSTYSRYDKLLSMYIGDQVLAFLMFSSSAAAAIAAQLSHRGVHNIWPPACSTWNLALFCSKADTAVVLSFLSSFFVIFSSVVSSYNLSKYMA